jgi:MtN3 and saliva related transmembrane protein
MSTSPLGVEAVGWVSSAILVATISRQVYAQWKSKATSGVSKWLFVGQISASAGYITYSVLLHNWVFLASNVAMIVTALLGELVFLVNRRSGDADGKRPKPDPTERAIRGDH